MVSSNYYSARTMPEEANPIKLHKSKWRPEGWSAASNPTYYKEVYALELKVVLDQVLEGKKQLPLKFKAAAMHLTVDSLALKIRLAWNYLYDHLDTADETYLKLYNSVTILKRPDGINLVPKLEPKPLAADVIEDASDVELGLHELNKKKFSKPTILGAEEISLAEAEDAPERVKPWRVKLEEWCLTAPEGEMFDKRISLSDEDIMWVETYLIPFLDKIAVVNITTRSIKLAKNEALAKRMLAEKGL